LPCDPLQNNSIITTLYDKNKRTIAVEGIDVHGNYIGTGCRVGRICVGRIHRAPIMLTVPVPMMVVGAASDRGHFVDA
jgi:hypothetical protein